MSKPMLNINLNINTNQSPSINTNNNTIINTIINTTQPAYLRDVTVTPAVTASSSSSSLEHALSPHKPPRLTLKVVNGSLSDVRFKARQRWSSIQGNRSGGGVLPVAREEMSGWSDFCFLLLFCSFILLSINHQPTINQPSTNHQPTIN